MARLILHVDMDEFFAAVEKLDRPELRGKPLLIGGEAKARGVVATASYEARPYGCHSAMPMAKALRLCPHAVVLPVRSSRYGEISRRVFAILERFTPVIEPLSIDEAFLDVTGCERLLGDGPTIAGRVKRSILDELGLTASVGVAPNKFLAKVASDLRKPDGLVVIDRSNLHQTLDPLPIRKLWGVGPSTARQFERLNIATVGQLRSASREALELVLGDWTDHYLALANGLDDREVTPDSRAKSIGQEETFAADIEELDELRRVLMGQVEQVAWRLRRHGLRARTVTLKLRYGDFRTITRSATLDEATDRTQTLWEAAASLLGAWAAASGGALRLLGVTASQFEHGQRQLGLFEDAASMRQERLDRAMDDIAKRFGRGTIRRGPT